MSDFEREYKKLNTMQKRAVDTIDGPLLVIAGPGTGKTQLLSLRVANILDKTDTGPDNILCLTFTNKAANNMRQRLSSMIGAPGNRIPIRTFHSFSAELMQQYPEYFWNGARLTNVPDTVQLEIITDILTRLPLSNPLALKFAGMYTGMRDIQDGLRLVKEAGLTPEKLQSLLELNISYLDIIEEQLVEICTPTLSYKKLNDIAAQIDALPDQTTDADTRPLVALTTVIKESFHSALMLDQGTNKTANVGKWKRKLVSTVAGQKGMHDERKRNAWWLALCGVYQKYRDELHARGYYDYADMIIEVITQLEKNPDLLASAQERYQYVLIDEFQDTNAAQLRLAHLISDHYATEGKPNIMVVGDDDQSIYKFNGAELSNMLGFRRSYPTCKVVVLTENYRSSQAVLDFSDKVISQASERVTTLETDIQKVLVARNEPKGSSSIRHVSYPTVDHQYHQIAREIQKAFEAEQGAVVVLARGHESLRKMATLLHKANVPVRYEQQQSILEQEIIQQIILVTRVVDAVALGRPTLVNHYLAELLSHPAWGVEPKQLWLLAVTNRKRKEWLQSLLDHEDEHIQTLGNWLLWLGQQSKLQPLPRMLELIIGLSASEHMTSPLREYFHKQNTIDTTYVAGLSATNLLTSLAYDFSRHGHSTLADFVRLVTVAQENGRFISDESVFVTAEHAVELMTIHKAKGLEFDHVFVIDAMDHVWKPIVNGRKPPMNLPLRPQGDDLDDFIRLMFVAITRAKQNVTISSYYGSIDGQSVLPSAIIRDILQPEEITAEKDQSVSILEQTLTWPRLEGSSEKLLLQDVFEGYSLSATALLDFLDVSRGGPQYFLERHLLRLPEATTTAAAFGSAMHAALEYGQQLTCQNKFDLDEMLARYESALKEQFLEDSEHDRYVKHGQEVLKQLFEKFGLRLQATGKPEVRIANIRLGDAKLIGVLDRVDADDGQILITDYKTGKPLTSLSTRNKMLQTKAWRHRTQLQYYTLIAQMSGEFKKTATYTAQMLYLEAESPKELTLMYTPTEEELVRLSLLIETVWQRIASYNLPDIRHYDQSYQGIESFEQDLLDGAI